MKSPSNSEIREMNRQEAVSESANARSDHEHEQNLVRLAICAFSFCYFAVMWWLGKREEVGIALPPLLCYLLNAVVALYLAARSPGHASARRIVGLLLDFGILTYFMIAFDALFAPFMFFWIWSTIGHGLRYGRSYLYGATLASGLCVAIVVLFDSYWRNLGSVSIAFLLLVIAVPLYTWLLQERLRVAKERTEARAAQLERHAKDLKRATELDPLTGIGNRISFMNALDEALSLPMSHEELIAVMILDLDGFKEVNDRDGHSAGDKVLVEVAGALTRSVRAIDRVARVGGDEFAVLLRHLQVDDDAERAAKKILQNLRDALQPWGPSSQVSASIGIATGRPTVNTGLSPANMLERADAAMYRAKKEGKDRYSFDQKGASLKPEPKLIPMEYSI